MPKHLRVRSSFVRGFLRGLAAPAEIYGRYDVRMPAAASVGEALRSDWNRVGGDLRSAVTRANGEATDKSTR